MTDFPYSGYYDDIFNCSIEKGDVSLIVISVR